MPHWSRLRKTPANRRISTTRQKRLDAADGKLRRFQDAIAAGVDPVALVEAINEAQAQREATKAELDGTPKPGGRNAAEVHAMVDSLGDVTKAIKETDPAKLQKLYEALGVEMTFNSEGRTVDATIRPVGRG